jgi:hypothetical protein
LTPHARGVRVGVAVQRGQILDRPLAGLACRHQLARRFSSQGLSMRRDRRPSIDITVRPADRPGDLGWVVMAHGEVYDRQFGWNIDFEALAAGIVADYALGHDGSREAAWIAEAGGERAGSIRPPDSP